MAALLANPDFDALYRAVTTHWMNAREVVIGAEQPGADPQRPQRSAAPTTAAERMMELDAVGFLPDDILVKVDRAAMAVGLETRAPFLDHRVFELAWRLPVSCKWRHGRVKWILRRMLERYLPNSLIDRPKQGFNVPMKNWLRGPLRSRAEEFLAEDRLRREAIFDAASIRRSGVSISQAHGTGTSSSERPDVQAWKSDIDIPGQYFRKAIAAAETRRNLDKEQIVPGAPECQKLIGEISAGDARRSRQS